jgi:hypothetical protein
MYVYIYIYIYIYIYVPIVVVTVRIFVQEFIVLITTTIYNSRMEDYVFLNIYHILVNRKKRHD